MSNALVLKKAGSEEERIFDLHGQKWVAKGDPEMLADMAEFVRSQNLIQQERRKAVEAARPALERLCEVMKDRSGQPYKVRNILYGLWNGKPCSIIELLNLDWDIRKDVCQVLLAFGFSDGNDEFFYNNIKDAVVRAGQGDWFIEEGQNVEVLEEYVKAAKRRARDERER